MSYSPVLEYMLDRLNGFSTNYFKILPQNSQSANSGAIVRFTMPSNSLLNMRSVALKFNATIAGTTTGGRFGEDMSSLIERVEVSVGGVQLSSGANYYNVLCQALRAVEKDMCDPVLGHSRMVREKSYVSGSTITTTNNEVYSSAGKPLFAIDKWHGFLGSCEPAILDTGNLPGDLVLTFYLADNNVLSSVKGVALSGTGANDIVDDGTGLATWSMSDIELNVEAVGLQSEAYSRMVDGLIASQGYLEVPFKQYFSFQDTNSGSQRFSCNTRCMDRIIVAHRDSDYNGQVGARVVEGYKVSGAFTSTVTVADTTAAGAITQDIGIPKYDIGGNYNYNSERYLTAHQNFPEPAGNPTYQFTINNAYLPTFKATWEEMWSITRNSVQRSPQYEHALDTMKSNYSVQVLRLNLPGSESSRILSGLNTAGISMNGYYNITGSSETPTVDIFVEATSVLKIGNNRQIEVLQ